MRKKVGTHNCSRLRTEPVAKLQRGRIFVGVKVRDAAARHARPQHPATVLCRNLFHLKRGQHFRFGNARNLGRQRVKHGRRLRAPVFRLRTGKLRHVVPEHDVAAFCVAESLGHAVEAKHVRADAHITSRRFLHHAQVHVAHVLLKRAVVRKRFRRQARRHRESQVFQRDRALVHCKTTEREAAQHVRWQRHGRKHNPRAQAGDAFQHVVPVVHKRC